MSEFPEQPDELTDGQWGQAFREFGVTGLTIIAKSWELANLPVEANALRSIRRAAKEIFGESVLRYMPTGPNDESIRLVYNGSMFRIAPAVSDELPNNSGDNAYEISTRHSVKEGHAVVYSINDLYRFVKEHA